MVCRQTDRLGLNHAGDQSILYGRWSSSLKSDSPYDGTLERCRLSARHLRPLIEYFSPAKVVQLNEERYCLVAEEEGRIVGTAAIEGEHIWTFFVHPDYQHKGFGTALLAGLEHAAYSLGLRRLLAAASLTGTSFYERHGYSRTGKVLDGIAGAQIEVEKRIHP
jgi:GNAT superfamily N-acetyltransferase